jgi:DNA-binding transcriptional MerR regulator
MTTRKLAEIAEILAIPESECRLIADEYENLLPAKKIGKVRVYDDNLTDRFRKIADLRFQGVPKDVIIPAIRGGKTLEERALEDMKRMGIETPEKEEKPQKPKPEAETDLILAVRSAGEAVKTMEHRMAAMREMMAADNAGILDAIAGVSAEVVKLKSEVHLLWDQTASLEKYFREQKRPFWKK